MKKIFLLTLFAFVYIITGCNGTGSNNGTSTDSTSTSSDTSKPVSVREESVNIATDTTTMQCFVAYNENKTGGRPVVLVIPEWWGVTNFTKNKARQLAELGYFALVVDMYGQGKVADNPKDAMKYSAPFYKDPQMATGRIQAALSKAKTYLQADSAKSAAIGFCFGGSMVLNAAKLGMPLDGVVSFHGGLQGVPATKNTVKSKILVLNGADDPFVPQKDITAFKKQLDAAGVPYTFKDYPGAVHAFTNPDASELGKKFNMPVAYNEQADKNSWNEMKEFFQELWK
jgi:dienelactone hydrolase